MLGRALATITENSNANDEALEKSTGTINVCIFLGRLSGTNITEQDASFTTLVAMIPSPSDFDFRPMA